MLLLNTCATIPTRVKDPVLLGDDSLSIFFDCSFYSIGWTRFIALRRYCTIYDTYRNNKLKMENYLLASRSYPPG